MLTFFFRVRYPGLAWRPKNAHDLLNPQLVRMWRASEDSIRTMQTLDNSRGKE